MPIRFLDNDEIDKQKWDNSITIAENGLIYAYSYYLDAMAKNWGALVLNDYEAVMPLTWNKKISIHYLYQPFFTACLGVFGKNISGELVSDFLNAIPQKFKYWDIYLNHGNYFPIIDFKLYERTNYILPLKDGYETLYSRFRENSKRNIKKAAQLNFVVKKGFPVTDVIAIAKEQSARFSPITNEDFQRFTDLYLLLALQKKAITYGVYSPENELVASCVFLFSHKRAYYILVGNHPNGKTIGASHMLIDAFIKDNAGADLLLDFEGSDIRNLAYFYSGFGASEEKYAGIKLNRLPRLFRFLKK